MMVLAVTAIFTILLLTGEGNLQDVMYDEPVFILLMGLGLMGMLSLMAGERTR